MKQYPLLGKGLAVGIILLFVGTCIIPAIAQNIEKTLLTSRGNWLYVGGSGPGNYTRIQDAIDNASNGDIVYVYDDSSPYIENINVNTSLSLIGENKTTTIIKPSYYYDTIYIRTSNVTVQGFTINCETVGGICISTNGVDYITISDNILLNGSCGITLRCDDAHGHNYYNVVEKNTISNCARAIHPWGVKYGRISNNSITENEIALDVESVYNTTFSYNIITMNSAGIDINYIQDCEIYNNTITNNGYGIWYWGKNNIIRNNYIGNNKGRGIMQCVAKNDVIRDNNIINNSGKGIEIASSSNIEITHNNLKENSRGSFIIRYSDGVKILQNNIIEKRPRFFYFEHIPPFNNIIIFENYWNNVQDRPKILFGLFSVLLRPGYTDDWGNFHPPLYLVFPGIKMDNKPATMPYDIGG
jgi:parallel beta-helix repeat protein